MRKKLLYLTLGIVATTLVVAVTTLSFTFQNQTLDRVTTQQEVLARMVTDQVELGLEFGSLEAVRSSLSRLSSSSTLEGTVLFDSEGTPLLALPERFEIAQDVADEVLRSGTAEVAGLSYVTSEVREAGGDAIGRLVIAFNVATVKAALRRAVLLALAVAVGVAIPLGWFAVTWVGRIVRPLGPTVDILEAVASGDLTERTVPQAQDEFARVVTAVQGMLKALRNLVSQIRSAAEQSAKMADQLSARTEAISASTDEVSSMAQRVSHEMAEQAEDLRRAVGDAGTIVDISAKLAEGARVANERNATLRETAEQHRLHLVEGSQRLAALADQIEQGGEEARELSGLSTRIEAFVTEAQAIASDTQLLALNAAIEAARAGAHGRGFAVVAEEIGRLSEQARQSAKTTGKTVTQVVETIGGTRSRLERMADDSAAVRAVAEGAAGALEAITSEAGQNSSWTEEISRAATEAQHVIEEITQRLGRITGGTESVAAAAEQLAATTQEQSGITQEIAGTAAHLAQAAERLTAAVRSFRLDGTGGEPHDGGEPADA